MVGNVDQAAEDLVRESIDMMNDCERWTNPKEEKGTTVWSPVNTSEGDVVMYCESTMLTDMDVAIDFFQDASNRVLYDPLCTSQEKVLDLNEEVSILYNNINLGWPLSLRDNYLLRVARPLANGSYIVALKSIANAPRNSGFVRGYTKFTTVLMDPTKDEEGNIVKGSYRHRFLLNTVFDSQVTMLLASKKGHGIYMRSITKLRECLNEHAKKLNK